MKIIILIAFILAGCGEKARPQIDFGSGTQSGFHTQSQTVKNKSAYISYTDKHGVPIGPVEGTPIVFNGKLYTIVGNSLGGRTMSSFRVDEVGVGLVASVPVADFHYVSAISHTGTVYVFGSVNRQKIQMRTSTNLVDWTPIVDVYVSQNGEEIFNSSVTHNGTNFVMALESRLPNAPTQFFIRFLSSSDLASWTITPALYSGVDFKNCPTIIYHNGYYYMLYMTWKIDAMMTFITRSTDLYTWEDSNYHPDGWTVPFAPSAGEGNNISDVDLVEHNGSVFFLFARGNQESWLELGTATFSGTMHEYLTSFWNYHGRIEYNDHLN